MKEPKLKSLHIDKKGTEEMHLRAKRLPKVKITINIDKEIIDQLREKAIESGVPYQTLLNKMLKDSFQSENHGSLQTEKRISRLEKEIAKIKKHIAA